MSAKKIGRYEVIAEIGRGGMATVYSANDPMFNRNVAIKVLPPELLHDPNFRTRFEREAKTVAGLEHTAIVPVYDFGESDGQLFFVMRLMSGESLADRIAKGPLPLKDIVQILTRIAPGLDYAHSQGVIHRDIKPANILFDQHGEPYLSDFGIAKLSETGATLTGNAIIGTPAYMSPEQGRGELDMDGRSDIYSLGAILFEMLSGKVPYEADTAMGQVVKHITAPIPNVLQLCPNLPEATQAIINSAMAKRKFARYNTAVEMAQALAAVAEGKGLPSKEVPATMTMLPDGPLPDVDAAADGHRMPLPGKTPLPRTSSGMGKPETSAHQQRKTTTPPAKAPAAKKKNKGGMGIVIFMVLLVLLGVAAVFFWPMLPQLLGQPTAAALAPSTPTITVESPPSATPLAPTATDTPIPVAVIDVTPTTEVIEPTATETQVPTSVPSGPVIGGADMLAFLKANDLWVVNLDGTQLEQITLTGGSKSSLQWTPDGQSVMFVAGRCVQSVDISSKQVDTILCVNWAEYLGGFAISPDGTQVALSLSDGLFILPYDLDLLRSIKQQDQLKAAEGCLQFTDNETKAVRWSADGKFLAVVVVGTDLGRQVELVKVMDVSRCHQDPIRVDEFPGTRFTMTGYAGDPFIQSFGWDGDMTFALNVDRLNGFGDLYLYNLSSHKAQMLNPVNNQCCYRDFTWSPDGQYMLFAFQDIRFAQQTILYYVQFGTLGTGGTYTAIPLPENFLVAADQWTQPALRPAP